MKIKKRKRIINNLLVTVIVMFVILCLSTVYIQNVQIKTEEETSQYLYEVALQSAKFVNEKINDDKNTLQAISDLIGESDAVIHGDFVLRSLNKIEQNTDFQKIVVADNKGTAYHITEKNPIDVSKADHYQRAMAGECFISNVVYSEDMNRDVVVVCVPIFRDGDIIGSIMGRYDIESFGRLVTVTSFGGEGSNYIANRKGEVFVHSDSRNDDPNFTNVSTGFDDTILQNNSDLKEMLKNMEEGKKGEVWYSWNGTEKIMSYIPVGINDWFLLSVAPIHIIASKSSYFFRHAFILVLSLSFLFVFITIYAVRLSRQKQIELRNVYKQLYLDEKRYSILMEQMKDIIFEWNMEDNTISYSEYFYEKFGYYLATENFPMSVIEQKRIEESDISQFFSIIQKMKEGIKYAEAEIRLQNKRQNGKFTWCKIRITAIGDENQKPKKAIGLISDIDKQKRQNEKIEEAANRDSLTGLYNKGATQRLIEEYIKQKENGKKGVLYVIDIDNFKGINDTMGHIFGDAALQKIGTNLKALFRSTDILGRIGGDEFVAFIPDIQKDFNLEVKSQKITEALYYSNFGPQGDYEISGSIGISRFPEDGCTFTELFDKADKALYHAKKHGKNQFAVYQKGFEILNR